MTDDPFKRLETMIRSVSKENASLRKTILQEADKRHALQQELAAVRGKDAPARDHIAGAVRRRVAAEKAPKAAKKKTQRRKKKSTLRSQQDLAQTLDGYTPQTNGHSPVAARILQAVAHGPKTVPQLNALLGYNKSEGKTAIWGALSPLERGEYVVVISRPSSGRGQRGPSVVVHASHIKLLKPIPV